MGAQCAICQQVYNTTDSKELQSIFLSDRKAGSYLNLTLQERKRYWQTLKNTKFILQSQNRLAPSQQQKEKVILYFPQKYLYEGSIQDGVPHGEGRLNIINKAIVEGTFNKGKINGQCRVDFKDQKQIKGSWVQGLPTQIQLIRQKGKYEVHFQDNKLNKGRVAFPNKSQYFGQFHFDTRQKTIVISGKGTLKYSNGQILEGQFINGYLQGAGTLKSIKQRYIYSGEFRRGLFNGQGTCDFGENGILRINWKDSKPEGKGQFTINGRSYNVIYQKGVRKQGQVSNVQQ